MDQANDKIALIKNIYFYLVAFVALMMVVFSLADLVNLGLKTWVFTKADGPNYYPMTGCATMPPAEVKSGQITVEQCAQMEEENRQRQEEERVASNQRNVVRDISFIVVGLPLFLIHWRILRKKEKT